MLLHYTQLTGRNSLAKYFISIATQYLNDCHLQTSLQWGRGDGLGVMICFHLIQPTNSNIIVLPCVLSA